MPDDKPRVLIIDDEPDLCELLEMTLSRMGLDCESCGSVAEARARIDASRHHLCLSDLRLPDGDGIEVVAYIQQRRPEVPVAVITAHGNVDAAVGALKAGAFDFVSKPVELAVLRRIVSTALKLSPTTERPEVGKRLIGRSPALEQLRQRIAKLARSQAPVYIHGESGTGKELAARLIHEQGARAEAPFVPVNCGAIPENLIESELFGHKKGSFSGAVQDREGLFLSAQGGTLFLDEIADLPLSMQVKLLRAIQEKRVRPVGHEQEIPVDVRILSATHSDLAQRVEEGRFREDLYYRVNVIELRVPPLRERAEDIPLLAEHILERIDPERIDGGNATRLGAAALQALKGYAFPGNIRELENILERALALCDSDEITSEDLGLRTAPAVEAPHTGLALDVDGQVGGSGGSADGGANLDDELVALERERIRQVLEQTRYNKTAAARQLGISFRALRYRLKKLGLE